MSIKDYAPDYFDALQRYRRYPNRQLVPNYAGNAASGELSNDLEVCLYYESDGRTDTVSIQLYRDRAPQFPLPLPLRLGDKAQIQGIVSGHLRTMDDARKKFRK